MALLSAPQANGLFSQAIAHSPGAMCREAGDLLSALSTQKNQPSSEIKALLASATWEEIIEVADTSEEEAAEATAQEPDINEDAEDGENSQENADNGKN